ncbi:aldehyde dehydrogenase family protein [Bifidobacterium eulemuris]|uniref:Aldehyde dehydrogenase n=1 Tax=Bifidobacterium eulemuris TaxID=1765219 RepID=A0A261G9U1_9BIFI|nr:aldehyde dehydrogenase family protein [Bifidobacterium eulemuris]OZG68180.1 aldehyde dehydrogenase [Bifidobacterium eulemuris]QOL31762.1 aldehyde dehydrogenase family protein [Bifidobacterium eulemuris]
MTHDIFSRLQRTFRSGRTKPLSWRRSQLDAMRRMLAENKPEIIEAVRADLGKPASETLLMEIDLVMDEARFVRRRMGMWSSRHPKPIHWLLQPAFGWTLAEPKGVALVISPWNYPVLLSLEPMVDAIAAGNAVCLKPSELSPTISHLLAELVARYLDPDAFAVVEGGPEETTALLEKPFDHIFYTGGGRVGKIVMEAAAKHLTPVTLELGGKSPCFVDHTVNLNTAARRIAWGKFTNAGQTCVAPDYVLATPDIAQMLADRIALAVTEFYGDDPRQSSDFARIVNERHFDRLTGLLADGGRLVCGGQTDRADRYIAPTVLFGTSPDAPVMREEIFGPILPILVVRDADAAIDFINERSRPLAAYVFSRDVETRKRFERDTSSGALGYAIPLGHLISSRLPFGGVGGSGIGAYHGKEGFKVFSHVKTVVDKPQFPDTLQVVYPPFTTLRQALIRIVAKLS